MEEPPYSGSTPRGKKNNNNSSNGNNGISQKTINHFIKTWGLRDENLVKTYICSLWTGRLYKTGTMYITENYVSFSSSLAKEAPLIAFRSIAQINGKSSSLSGNAIVIRDKADKEYYFSTFYNRDETITVLQQLYRLAIDKLLISTSVDTLEQAQLSSHSLGIKFNNLTCSASMELSGVRPSILNPKIKSIEVHQTAALKNCSSSPLAPGREATEGDTACSVGDPGPTSPFSLSLNTLPKVDTPIPDGIASQLQRKRTGSVPLDAVSPLASPQDSPSALDTANSHRVSSGEFKSDISTLLRTKNTNENFQSLFRLPVQESVLDMFLCTYSFSKKKHYKGHCFLSRNFFNFYCHNGKSDWLSLVIPFKDVTDLQKEPTGLWSNNGISIEAEDTRFFFVVPKNRDEKFLSLLKLRMGAISRAAIASDPDNESTWGISKTGSMPWTETFLKERTDFSVDYLEKQAGLFPVWESRMARYSTAACLIKTPRLKEWIRNGIPDELRGMLWQTCSGSVNKAAANPGYYRYLVSEYGEKKSASSDEIEKDLHRSFPDHPFYQTEEGIGSLRRVLRAYAWRNSDVGYCQSMNFVCSLLLLYMSEESAFWLMCTICEDLVSEYYHRAMVGSMVDQTILEHLIETFLPEVAACMAEKQVPLALITLPWFLCLFIGYLPMEYTLRVLDSFFYEGPNALFRSGLAVVHLKRKEILSADDGGTLMISLRDKLQVEGEELLRVAYSEYEQLPVDKIRELRGKHKLKVIDNLHTSKLRTKIRNLARKTNFTEAELRAIFRKFEGAIATDATFASVDVAAFQNLFFQFAPYWKTDPTLANKAFRVFDSERRGLLDFTSFTVGLSAVCKGSIVDRFVLCCRMHLTHARHKDEGEEQQEEYLSELQFSSALDALIQMYQKRTSSRGITFKSATDTKKMRIFVQRQFDIPQYFDKEHPDKMSLSVARKWVEENHATIAEHFDLPTDTT